MVKFGILSDTLITSDDNNEYQKNILNQISRAFKGIDQIIHAGNVIAPEFLKLLKTIAPVNCVKGDLDQIMELKEFLRIPAGKYNLGVIHKKPDNLELFFKQNNLHILIFGHTRQVLIEGTKFNTLLINPGSPTKPIAPPAKKGFEKPLPRPSVITLSIDENNILSTFIINLKNK